MRKYVAILLFAAVCFQVLIYGSALEPDLNEDSDDMPAEPPDPAELAKGSYKKIDGRWFWIWPWRRRTRKPHPIPNPTQPITIKPDPTHSTKAEPTVPVTVKPTGPVKPDPTGPVKPGPTPPDVVETVGTERSVEGRKGSMCSNQLYECVTENNKFGVLCVKTDWSPEEQACLMEPLDGVLQRCKQTWPDTEVAIPKHPPIPC